jgi:hypothetical protein
VLRELRRKKWLLCAIEFALIQVACSKSDSNNHAEEKRNQGSPGLIHGSKKNLNNRAPFFGSAYRYRGPRSGGTLLSMYMNSTDADTTISIGGIPCTPFKPAGTCLDSNNFNRCLCLTGASPSAGEFDIKITNSGGKYQILKNVFTYRDSIPSTHSMAIDRPFYHAIDKAEKFLIKGRDLSPKIQILVDGDVCTVSDFVSTESEVNDVDLTCELGPTQKSLGHKDVVFLNPDGSGFTVPGGFVYTAPVPEVDSFQPLVAGFQEEVRLSVRGRNFQSGMQVSVGNYRCNHIEYHVPELVTCDVMVPLQTRNLRTSITLTNPDGGRKTVDGMIFRVRNGNAGLGESLSEATGDRRPIINTQTGLRQEAQRRVFTTPTSVLDSTPSLMLRWVTQANQRITQRTAVRNRLGAGPAYGRVETVMNAQVTRRYLEAIDNLERRYPSAVPNCDHSLSEIYEMIRNLPADHRGPSGEQKKEAALRYLDRVITGHEHDEDFRYNYSREAFLQDPNQSGLTNKQLLSLAWYAIHDPLEFNEAQKQDRYWGLLESLANIQRAHNDAQDVVNFDLAAEVDSPSCGPGTFKRLIEHLDLSHSGVQLTELATLPRITNSMVAHEVQLQHQVLFRGLSPEDSLSIEESLQSVLDIPEAEEANHASAHVYHGYVERLRNQVRHVASDIPLNLLHTNTNRDTMQALLGVY